MNVEGNFFPNVDYETCFTDQGIYVLGCGPAYAQAVAEHSLGLALDIARGISREDRAFRDGTERYVATATTTRSCCAAQPSGCSASATSVARCTACSCPSLPTSACSTRGCPKPSCASRASRPRPWTRHWRRASSCSFSLLPRPRASTSLGARELDLVPSGARLVLVSRAAVVDYDALLNRDQRTDGSSPPSTCGPRSRSPPTTRPAGWRAWSSRGHRAGGIPAAFPRSARWSSTTCADRPRTPAGAHAGRRAGTRRPLPQPAGELSPSHVAGPTGRHLDRRDRGDRVRLRRRPDRFRRRRDRGLDRVGAGP